MDTFSYHKIKIIDFSRFKMLNIFLNHSIPVNSPFSLLEETLNGSLLPNYIINPINLHFSKTANTHTHNNNTHLEY